MRKWSSFTPIAVLVLLIVGPAPLPSLNCDIPSKSWNYGNCFASTWLASPLSGVSAFDLQDARSIEAAVNASVEDLHKLRFAGGVGLGRLHHSSGNLSRTPPGLDGALAAEQAASEARCRNMYTAQPDFIRWTSPESPHLASKQNRHDLDVIPPPPLLWAFPGSGASWLRLLTEYISGHLTGSVDVDPTVTGILRGETHGCDRGVLLLHADAQRHKIERLIKSPVKYVCNTKVSNLRDPFAKVIVVVRNPYDTIWEAFMLELYRKHNLTPAGKTKKGALAVNAQHGAVRKSLFEQVEFQERAKELANAWVQFLSGANRWTKRLPHGVLVLQLEQLFSVSAMGSAASTGQDVGRQPWLRCLALGRLLGFLGVDMATHGGGLTSGERCTCGFVLAASAPWDRNPVERPPKRFAASSVPEHVSQNFVSRDEAYRDDPRLVCDIWHRVRDKAVKFAYRPYGTARCFL